MKAIENILNIVIEMNDNGIEFPLWSTCLGYEGMLLSISKYTLKWNLVNSKNHSLPIDTNSNFDKIFVNK